MKFNDGFNHEIALLAYYNSIDFAFIELCGRSYSGDVLEILPKVVGSVMLPDLFPWNSKRGNRGIPAFHRWRDTLQPEHRSCFWTVLIPRSLLIDLD